MFSYERLGVPVVVNGVGPATRIGGLAMSSGVWEAMARSTERSVRISDLQRRAGEHISELLGVPASYVTSGAAAALQLAAAITMTGADAALIDQLPDTTGMRNEILVQAAHRDPYDRAVVATGATVVTVGYPASTHPGELERVIGERTAAVLVRPGAAGNLLTLRQVAVIAHSHAVPVIVDGALQAPPLDRLHRFFDDGADLVAVSGGKGFRGPQASGLLCGNPDLIKIAALHHQDMDERSETWHTGQTDDVNTPPRHGIARSMKVGREQIVGLLTAIKEYVDGRSIHAVEGLRELKLLYTTLRTETRLRADMVHLDSLDVPHIEITIGTPDQVDATVNHLASLETPVLLGEELAWAGKLTVNPMALRPGDADTIARALSDVVAIPSNVRKP